MQQTRGESYAKLEIDRLDLLSALTVILANCVIHTNIIVQVDFLENTCVSVSALSLE
jgi:hypothetical protein